MPRTREIQSTKKDKDAEIQSWIQRYQELATRLGERSDSLAVQAKAKLDAGDLEGAEKLLKESLEKNMKAVAEGKKAAAADAFQLGSIKELQLDYNVARGYYEQATELEPENSLYLNNFGYLLETLCEHSKAIEYYSKALEIDLKVYGDKHPIVANRYNNLGVAWQSLGKYRKAIDYFTKALEIDLKVYGDNHPSVARDYNNLGEAWVDQASPIRRLNIYQGPRNQPEGLRGQASQCCQIIQQPRFSSEQFARIPEGDGLLHQGPRNRPEGLTGTSIPILQPYTTTSVQLGSNSRENQRAIGYYTKALEINLKVYGDKHPDVAMVYNNLGSALGKISDNQKAIDYYTKALEICTEKLGPEHPHTKMVKANLEAAEKALKAPASGAVK